MNEAPSLADGTEMDLPAWNRKEAFPRVQSSKPYGILGERGEVLAEFDLFSDFRKHIAERGAWLVWTPDSTHCQVAEEIEELDVILAKRQAVLIRRREESSKRHTLIGGLIAFFFAYQEWNAGRLPWRSGTVGLIVFFVFIFGIVPWYDSWKSRRQLLSRQPGLDLREIATARFEVWLTQGRALVTKGLLALIGMVGIGQLLVEGGLMKIFSLLWLKSPPLAWLTKPLPTEEWWRLWTASFLHGNGLHFLMNAAALNYLGKRVEALARWPHLLMVFLSSMLLGGMFSVWFSPDKPSVGASGGIMGLLGFLVVFEILHPQLVPKPARRRLLSAVGLTFIMGIIGYQFIDNSAHLGGLLAGMVYGLTVFPRSSSPHRPMPTKLDYVFGIGVGILLVGTAFFTLRILLTAGGSLKF